MANQIQWRRDTGSNWSSVNPILAEGEIGLNLTNGQFKIGDGTSNWNDLTYYSTGTLQYKAVNYTYYTSNSDAVTSITPLSTTSESLVGCDIIFIIKEIKPLTNSQYSWNKTTGVLTLSGVELYTDESLFIVYSKLVNL